MRVQNETIAHQNILRRAQSDFRSTELRQAELLSGLVHKLGHEIGNPLTSIISLATILERFSGPESINSPQGQAVTDKISAYSASIIEEAWRISGLVEKLVLLLSSRSGNLCQCDIAKIIQRALNKLHLRRKFDTSDVLLHFSGEESCQAFVDPDQFLILMIELLGNAFQEAGCSSSQESDPQILVEVYNSGQQTICTVKNPWHNVYQDDLALLFEPFQSHRPDGKNLGLGLTMAQAIVDRFQGGIEILETVENGQSFFNIRLIIPGRDDAATRTTSEGPEKNAREAKQSDIKSRVALIVEDEETVASAIKKILELAFSDRVNLTLHCLSGSQALQWLESDRAFDVLLCDLNLDGTSGRHIFEVLCDKRPGDIKKFAFLTGDQTRPETKLFLRTSNRPFLDKPFGQEELIELVTELLR